MQTSPKRDLNFSAGDGPAPLSGQAAGKKPELGDLAGFPLDSVMRIPVLLQVVLGSTSIPVSHLLKLGRGSVIALDHRVGEPVDVVVNGRVIARGEVVVVDEASSRFGVSLTEIVGPAAPQTA